MVATGRKVSRELARGFLMVVVVFSIVVPIGWYTHAFLACRYNAELNWATLQSLSPLPTYSHINTLDELDAAKAWVAKRRSWVATQNFDQCVERSYENWFGYVERRLKADETALTLQLPKAP